MNARDAAQLSTGHTAPHLEGAARASKNGAAVALLLFFVSLYSLTVRGVPPGGDPLAMFLMTESLLRDRSVFIENDQSTYLVPAPGGKYTSKYGLLQSVAEMPLLAAASLFFPDSGAGDAYPFHVRYLVTSFTTPVVSALWCLTVFFFALELGFTRRLSLFLSLLAGCATLTLPHSKSLYSEPLQGLLLTSACLWAFRASKSRGVPPVFYCGAAAGLLVLTKPVNILLFPIFLFYIAATLPGRGEGRRRTLAYPAALIAPVAVCALAALWFNRARFGDPWEFGYTAGFSRDTLYGFSLPLWMGVYGLVASTGKGILIYVPVTWFLFSVWRGFLRENRREALLFAALAAVFLCIYGKWNQWHGDYAWGPRFLVPLMGLIVLPAGYLLRDFACWSAWKKGAAALVISASLFIQFLGTAVNSHEYIRLVKTQVPYGILFRPGRLDLRDELLLTHFVPDFSPIAGHWWLLKHTVTGKGGKPDGTLKNMRDDFPWKNLARYAAPADPRPALGWDFWWDYFPRYFPGSRSWTRPLAAAMSAPLALSSVLLILFMKKAAPSRDEPGSLEKKPPA
ncbi:MAG: hypothetical protein AB1742_01980 [bacterium]